jgi:hypothetical protein
MSTFYHDNTIKSFLNDSQHPNLVDETNIFILDLTTWVKSNRYVYIFFLICNANDFTLLIVD